MIAYIDSSVLLRILLREPNALPEWDQLTHGISSQLLSVECFRAIDQLWHRDELTERDIAEKRPLLMAFLPRVNLQPLSDDVLDLASQPLPTPLATLDALHLATAMLYRDAHTANILFATHDRQLATAARAMHFEVIGV